MSEKALEIALLKWQEKGKTCCEGCWVSAQDIKTITAFRCGFRDAWGAAKEEGRLEEREGRVEQGNANKESGE